MVETSFSFGFMRSLSPSRASAPSHSSLFGSCKQGWYYRCLGVDP
ncbi:hypothetical protein PHAVU_003G031801 [Phaseolus vulgaris]